MSDFLSWWNNFWGSKKKLFILLLVLIVSFFSFNALKLTLNEDINQVFSEKEVATMLASSQNKKVFISIHTKNTKLEYNKIEKDIVNTLGIKFPNQLSFLEHEPKNSSFADIIYKNIPFYLEDSDYTIIQDRLSNIDSILEANHKSLFSPSSAINKEMIFKDPLALKDLIIKENNDLFNSSYLQSEDGEKLLIGDLTNTDILHVTPIYEALQEIKMKYSDLNINISFFSVSFIPVVNEIQIKKDLRVTLSFTIIMILLILIIVFRSYFLPVLFVLPAIFGIIFSLAFFYWFKGSISAIALGSGAIVFGIVIDYSFHFFSHQKHNQNNSKTIKELYKPLFFSAFTTIIAFYALTFTNSQVLQDFGWLASFGLMGSFLFVVLALPIISPIPKQIPNKKNFTLKISNQTKKYIAIVILILTGLFLFKADKVSFDKNIEHLNFFPEALKNSERDLVGINSENEKSLLLFVKGNTQESTKDKNLDLLIFLKDLKDQKKIKKYSNLSFLNLPKKAATHKKLIWEKFWGKNYTTLKETINNYALTQAYNKNAFDDFFELIDSDIKFIPLLSNKETLSKVNIKNQESWIAKSSIIINKENKESIIKLLSINNINYIDKASVASEMLVNIKDDFNFLLFYTGILVFIILLIIYGRIELALITFLPMLISWIWILGICSILGIQFNFVNIIISTLIFGIGDDFAIFISDGYLRKYKTDDNIINVNLQSIFLSALTTIIALGSLMFAKHPAINSIAPISIIGMISILIISFFLQPFLYKWLIINRTKNQLAPVTLSNLSASLFSYTLFVGGSLLLSLISLFASIIPAIQKNIKPLFHLLIQKTCWLIVFVAVNVKRRKFNTENLDFAKPSIIITNHQSFVDILQMLMLSPKIVLLVKDWVYYSPIFGKLIRYLDFIPTSNGVEKNLTKIQELTNKGYSIMIFPEGKRSETEKLGRFHQGAFLIAEKLNLDITPILLHGYGNTIKKNDLLIKRSIISYKVLPRISCSDQKFGIDYRNRNKNIKKYFSEKLNHFTKEREDINYLYGNIKSNIDYKGPIIEWYYKIKWRLESKNYEYYNSLMPENAKIYDLGCGYGFLSCFLMLKSKKRQIIGIDYDSDKINIANNYFMFKNLHNLRFMNQNILNLKLNTPDVILLHDVLHYLDDLSQSHILINCMKNLNDNGIILIREGEKSNNKHTFTKFTELMSTKIFRFNKTEGKLNFLSKLYLENLAKKYNFKIKTINHSMITSNKLFILSKS